MQSWMNFFISGFQSVIRLVESWQIFGVSVLGLIAAFFIMEVTLRALLYKA